MHRMIGGRGAGEVMVSSASKAMTRSRIDAPHSNLRGLGVLALDHSEGYMEFSESLRRELAPGNVLEGVLVDRIILAAWDLHTLSLAATRGDGSAAIARRDEAKAERSLVRCLGALEKMRAGSLSQWGRPAAAAPAPAGPSDEADEVWADPIEPAEDRPRARLVADVEEFEPEPAEEVEDCSVLWRDRLVLDPNVSADSPVVRGTWVTVGHIVSLVVDGWTWADILRAHPELTEGDIRACLAYAVEVEDSGLSLDEG